MRTHRSLIGWLRGRLDTVGVEVMATVDGPRLLPPRGRTSLLCSPVS
jgi:hypothetical protein